MSLVGQKRKWPRWNGMSVLPSTTDIVRPPLHVRFVPNPDCELSNDRHER